MRAESVRDELSAAELTVLRDAYEVGDWQHAQRTPKGSTNTSFFVTADEGRFVLRRSNTRKTREHIEFEVGVIAYLREHGYPAPEVVPTRDGRGYVTVDDRLYLMTVMIDGEHYDAANPAHLANTARMLARYHRLVETLPGPLPVTSDPLDALIEERATIAFAGVERLAGELLDPGAVDELRGHIAAVAQHAQRLSGQAGVLDGLPRRLVQGSFGRSAVIFEGDDIIGVVDYDRVAVDLRAIDLAYSVKALCRSAIQRGWVGLDMASFKEFIDAYQEVEVLPTVEIEALPLVFQLQRMKKVVRKCENLLQKHSELPQAAKDVEKVAAILEREDGRVGWLDESNDRLVAELIG